MVVLTVFLLTFSGVLAIPEVRAQTTSISHLTYPTTPVTGSNVKVSYDLSYSGLVAKNEILVAFVYDSGAKTYATGTGSSTPDTCIPFTGTDYADKAVCAWVLLQGSGTEHLTFYLQFSTHRQTYSLAAAAAVGTTAGEVVFSSASEQKFSITVGSKVQLTVNTQTIVPVSVDGIPAGTGTTSVQVDPGTHLISVPSIVPIDDLNQLRFDHWDDGSTGAARSVDVERDTTVQAVYVTQHRLILNSTVNATGAGWYDYGSTAKFSVPQSAPLEGVLGMLGGRLQFKGWYENGRLVTASNSGTIQMNEVHSLGARWQADYTIPIAIIGGIAAVIVVGVVLALRTSTSRKRRR